MSHTAAVEGTPPAKHHEPESNAYAPKCSCTDTDPAKPLRCETTQTLLDTKLQVVTQLRDIE